MSHALTQDELKRHLSYDPETGIFRWKTALNKRIRVGSLAGCINGVSGYLMIMIHRKKYAAHRLAFIYMLGSFPAEDVDHINGVREDNRWSNLRPVSRAENMMNCGIRSDNASGSTGVSWNKHHGKWQSAIHADGVQIHIGYFHQLEEAVSARKDMARQLGYHDNHGNVARTWGKK